MAQNLIDLSFTQLSEQIRKKTISPVELTTALLQRIDQTEAQLNAYISVYKEEALQKAKTAEQEINSGNYKGRFHGIPLALKDNIFFKDHTTTMASKIHKDFKPRYNATVIEKLEQAGAIILGKLNMHEYALSITSDSPHFGAVSNPWDLSKTPGGSSGGSAAAIAAKSTPFSIGTDTAGSIRIPAAACGIVGFKPSRGLVSSYGVFPLSWTQDHVGPMGRSVKDVTQILDTIAGFDEKDPVSLEFKQNNELNNLNGDVSGMTIGIEEDYFFNKIDAPIEKATRKVIETLKEKGAKVKTIKLPALKDMDWAGFTLSVSEASAIHQSSIIEQPESFGEDIRGFLTSGAFPSSDIYNKALQVRQEIIKDFQKAFEEIDVLIAPTLPVFPSKIGDTHVPLNGEEVEVLLNFIRLTGPANISGIPALSVPCGIHNGLPIGVQVMGKSLADHTVLNAGLAIEQTKLFDEEYPTL